MEGPQVPSEAREAPKGVGLGRSAVGPLCYADLGAMHQKIFQKVNVEVAPFVHFCQL